MHIKIDNNKRIILGLIIGVVLGYIFYKNSTFIHMMETIGKVFLNLIFICILPLIVSMIITGFAHFRKDLKLGRVIVKILIIFEILIVIAIIVSLIISNLIPIGHMINFDMGNVDLNVISDIQVNNNTHIENLIMSIFPSNIFSALNDHNILGVLFFTVLFALGILGIGDKGDVLFDFFEAVSDVMLNIINKVMLFAPLGVCALISVLIAQLGINSLFSWSLLILLIFFTMTIYIFGVLGLIFKYMGISLIKFLKYIKEEILLAFGTSSSEVTLPKIMQKLNKAGVDETITSIALPLGYSFNFDGAAIHETVVLIFLMQVYNIPFTMTNIISLAIILLVVSKGIAAVPGTALIVILTGATSLGIPLAGVAVIASFDRIIDMYSTVTNMISNSSATLFIAKSENAIDIDKFNKYLGTAKNSKVSMKK